MKNARPLNEEESSAPNRSDFTATFPHRHGTVAAEVLRRLLDGERLTSLDAVFDSHTTRLAAFVHYLTRDYGWEVSRIDKAVGTVDGRVTEIREYFLAPALLQQARAAGAAEYTALVTEARAIQRAAASKAKIEAKRRNTRRLLPVVAHV
ncbi:MAG: hypothetical protein EOO23_07555 [Comamonadaceae bacterium]|nr:MAG: hypothetical protein EOO23_07555 [Comamonadaceae bacterium]